MKLYIAGPMTGHENLNFPAFKVAAGHMRRLGHEVVNPAELNTDPDAEWLTCMRADIKQLVDCDGVVMLPGWATSKGAKIEHGIAVELGLRVFVLVESASGLVSVA